MRRGERPGRRGHDVHQGLAAIYFAVDAAGHRTDYGYRLYALIATGELIGTGRWTFTQDGPEVVITYDWRVSTSKPLLRWLTWLLRPVFAANHRWAMARGEESLRLELHRRRATSEAER